MDTAKDAVTFVSHRCEAGREGGRLMWCAVI